jgi:hypothetical protein
MNPAGQLRQATLDRASGLASSEAAFSIPAISRVGSSSATSAFRLSGHPPCPRATASRYRRLALQALLEQTRLRTWRLWARDGAIEFGRPKCWYRDVSDTDKTAETAWLRQNVMGRIKPYRRCGSRRMTGTRIDAGPGVNLWLSRQTALPIALKGAGAAQ